MLDSYVSNEYIEKQEDVSMELRVLNYFLAVARQQSISGAAESLHLSQPTLSRQLKELEEELGKQLFIRGSRTITLTEDGMLLKKRAEQILDLVQKTEQEIALTDTVAGDIYIGTGETESMRFIAKIARRLQEEYPDIHYHIISADADFVSEQLDKGLIDFGIIIGSSNALSKYDYLKLPVRDSWGILMHRDSHLAEKKYITANDLINEPLIVSRQALESNDIKRWMMTDPEKLNIVATYNLIYNASILVSEGLGYAFCLDKLVNVSGNCSLTFRPFLPQTELNLYIAWKKYPQLNKAADIFLKAIEESI